MRKLKDTDRHIVDSIGDLLESAGGLIRVRRLQAGSLSFDRAVWAKLAEHGWLGAAVPETQGGTGIELRQILLLLEQAGRRLMPEPLVQVLAATGILSRCRGEHAAALGAEVIAGKTIAVAVDASDRAPLAAKAGQLSGETAYISDGHAADRFLILTQSGEEIRAVAIPRALPGVTVETEETVDGGSIARLNLAGVTLSDLPILATGTEAVAAFRAGRELALLGFAALLTGLMDEALQITVQYLKDRKQFGVPIGSFQALQHRAASLYVVIHASRAFLHEAARAGAGRRSIAALAAKSYASEAAMQTVKECVALHGAIGYTAEHNMSLFFRRAMALAAAGGDAVSCRKALHAERALVQDT